MSTTTSIGIAPKPSTSTRSGRALGASLAIAAAVQAAANLFFHASVSRRLDATGYGTVATLLAAVLLLTVPLGSLQVAVATARRAALDANPRRLVERVALGSTVIGVLVVVAAPWVASFLHLPSARLAMMLTPCLVFGAVAACLRGVALGEGRVGRVAASVVISSAVRVAFGFALVARLGIAGAMWATILAELAGALAVGLPTFSGRLDLRLGWVHVMRNSSVVLGLWLFTGVDSILARHYLGADGASGYLAAGTLTRAGLALPLALVMANIANFTQDDRDAARRGALRVASVVAAWGALTAAGFVVLGTVAQHVLFGSVMAPAGLLVLLAVVAGVSGLITTFTYFLLAQRRFAAQLPWIAAVVEIAVIGVWHDSALHVAMGSGVSLMVALAVMAVAVQRTPVADPMVSPAPMALDATLWAPADPAIELSVIVPFYNPGDSVGRTLSSMVSLFRAAGVGFEVVAVSDGSTDGSEAHVLAVAAPEVRLIVLPENHGKGGALMRGFSAARGTFVAFIDADGDIDPVHLVGYLDHIRQGGDMVYACKRHGDSASASSALRKVISIGFSTYTGALFRLGVADTQTGCKVMRRSMMADVLPHMHERRFAFDLELFVVAKQRGFTDMRPAPVELGERLAGSTVTTKAVLRTLRDSLTIWKRLHLHSLYPAASREQGISAFEDLGQLQAVA
jgi:O-antigen/teichoic acid export membrane protein